MQATGKIFGKVSLKAIRVFYYFQYIVCDQARDGVLNILVGSGIQQKEKVILF